MSPKTTPMHASTAGAQACVVGACAVVPIFSATAIAAVRCSPTKHSRIMTGRKPQTTSVGSFGAHGTGRLSSTKQRWPHQCSTVNLWHSRDGEPSTASTDMEMRLQALSLLNTCGLHDFLPHRNFTGYACIQTLRPLVLQSDASLEHFNLKVPLLQDCLG